MGIKIPYGMNLIRETKHRGHTLRMLGPENLDDIYQLPTIVIYDRDDEEVIQLSNWHKALKWVDKKEKKETA